MVYSIVIFTGSLIGRVIAVFDKKTKRFFSLRKGEMARVKAHFQSTKDGSGNHSMTDSGANAKLLWFHAASAGELEQAKPVIDYIKRGDKEGPLVIASFFSPSGFDAGLKYNNIDFCFNLPLDYKKNVCTLLDCIRPELLVFSKHDVWKNLTIEASRRGVNTVLVSATLPEKSLRHKWPFRLFFKGAYRAIDRIYAISEKDGARFRKITGPSTKDSVKLAGDTRFDRVKTVSMGSGPESKPESKRVLVREEGCFYLLAGSTYKMSEKRILEASLLLNKQGIPLRLIITPHEVDRKNIARLERQIYSYGFIPVCYSDSKLPIRLKNSEVLIVDAFGVLPLLYDEADSVFVGGSYKGSVHSCLEPAVFGKPILTGPHISNSYEALALKETGGLSVCKNKDDLITEIKRLATDSSHRENVSKKVNDFFHSYTGAAHFVIKDLNRLEIL